MANWKLSLWARITRRAACETCGELIATTTMTDPTGTSPACTHCAAWIAAGSPDKYDEYYATAYQTAMNDLPYLLLHRPSLRDLNRLSASFDGERDEQARAETWKQLCRQYTDATPLTRWAYDHASPWWHELRFHAGNVSDWVRITIARPNCARCDAKAITTSQFRADQRRRTPLCDGCHSAIAEGIELPSGGAR